MSAASHPPRRTRAPEPFGAVPLDGSPAPLTARDTRRLLGALVLVDVVLLGFYLLDWATDGRFWTVHTLFDLDGEGNVPAWWASAKLLGVGAALLYAGASARARRSPLALALTLAGAGFVFLSMDEAAWVHEKITTVLEGRGGFAFSGGHGRWIPVYAVLGLGLLVAFRRALVSLWREHRRETAVMAAGMFVLVLGGVGVEVLGYELVGDDGPLSLRRPQVAAEEFLELVGVSVVLYGAVLFALRFRGRPAADRSSIAGS